MPYRERSFVLVTSLLMGRDDPSKACTQKTPTKPRYQVSVSIQTPPAVSPLAYCDADQMLLLLVSVHNELLPTPWCMTSPTSHILQYCPSIFSPRAYKPVRTVCLLAHRSPSVLPLTPYCMDHFQVSPPRPALIPPLLIDPPPPCSPEHVSSFGKMLAR